MLNPKLRLFLAHLLPGLRVVLQRFALALVLAPAGYASEVAPVASELVPVTPVTENSFRTGLKAIDDLLEAATDRQEIAKLRQKKADFLKDQLDRAPTKQLELEIKAHKRAYNKELGEILIKEKQRLSLGNNTPTEQPKDKAKVKSEPGKNTPRASKELNKMANNVGKESTLDPQTQEASRKENKDLREKVTKSLKAPDNQVKSPKESKELIKQKEIVDSLKARESKLIKARENLLATSNRTAEQSSQLASVDFQLHTLQVELMKNSMVAEPTPKNANSALHKFNQLERDQLSKEKGEVTKALEKLNKLQGELKKLQSKTAGNTGHNFEIPTHSGEIAETEKQVSKLSPKTKKKVQEKINEYTKALKKFEEFAIHSQFKVNEASATPSAPLSAADKPAAPTTVPDTATKIPTNSVIEAKTAPTPVTPLTAVDVDEKIKLKDEDIKAAKKILNEMETSTRNEKTEYQHWKAKQAVHDLAAEKVDLLNEKARLIGGAPFSSPQLEIDGEKREVLRDAREAIERKLPSAKASEPTVAKVEPVPSSAPAIADTPKDITKDTVKDTSPSAAQELKVAETKTLEPKTEPAPQKPISQPAKILEKESTSTKTTEINLDSISEKAPTKEALTKLSAEKVLKLNGEVLEKLDELNKQKKALPKNDPALPEIKQQIKNLKETKSNLPSMKKLHEAQREKFHKAFAALENTIKANYSEDIIIKSNINQKIDAVLENFNTLLERYGLTADGKPRDISPLEKDPNFKKFEKVQGALETYYKVVKEYNSVASEYQKSGKAPKEVKPLDMKTFEKFKFKPIEGNLKDYIKTNKPIPASEKPTAPKESEPAVQTLTTSAEPKPLTQLEQTQADKELLKREIAGFAENSDRSHEWDLRKKLRETIEAQISQSEALGKPTGNLHEELVKTIKEEIKRAKELEKPGEVAGINADTARNHEWDLRKKLRDTIEAQISQSEALGKPTGNLHEELVKTIKEEIKRAKELEKPTEELGQKLKDAQRKHLGSVLKAEISESELFGLSTDKLHEKLAQNIKEEIKRTEELGKPTEELKKELQKVEAKIKETAKPQEKIKEKQPESKVADPKITKKKQEPGQANSQPATTENSQKKTQPELPKEQQATLKTEGNQPKSTVNTKNTQEEKDIKATQKQKKTAKTLPSKADETKVDDLENLLGDLKEKKEQKELKESTNPPAKKDSPSPDSLMPHAEVTPLLEAPKTVPTAMSNEFREHPEMKLLLDAQKTASTEMGKQFKDFENHPLYKKLQDKPLLPTDAVQANKSLDDINKLIGDINKKSDIAKKLKLDNQQKKEAVTTLGALRDKIGQYISHSEAITQKHEELTLKAKTPEPSQKSPKDQTSSQNTLQKDPKKTTNTPQETPKPSVKGAEPTSVSQITRQESYVEPIMAQPEITKAQEAKEAAYKTLEERFKSFSNRFKEQYKELITAPPHDLKEAKAHLEKINDTLGGSSKKKEQIKKMRGLTNAHDPLKPSTATPLFSQKEIEPALEELKFLAKTYEGYIEAEQKLTQKTGELKKENNAFSESTRDRLAKDHTFNSILSNTDEIFENTDKFDQQGASKQPKQTSTTTETKPTKTPTPAAPPKQDVQTTTSVPAQSELNPSVSESSVNKDKPKTNEKQDLAETLKKKDALATPTPAEPGLRTLEDFENRLEEKEKYLKKLQSERFELSERKGSIKAIEHIDTNINQVSKEVGNLKETIKPLEAARFKEENLIQKIDKEEQARADKAKGTLEQRTKKASKEIQKLYKERNKFYEAKIKPVLQKLPALQHEKLLEMPIKEVRQFIEKLQALEKQAATADLKNRQAELKKAISLLEEYQKLNIEHTQKEAYYGENGKAWAAEKEAIEKEKAKKIESAKTKSAKTASNEQSENHNLTGDKSFGEEEAKSPPFKRGPTEYGFMPVVPAKQEGPLKDLPSLNPENAPLSRELIDYNLEDEGKRMPTLEDLLEDKATVYDAATKKLEETLTNLKKELNKPDMTHQDALKDLQNMGEDKGKYKDYESAINKYGKAKEEYTEVQQKRDNELAQGISVKAHKNRTGLSEVNAVLDAAKKAPTQPKLVEKETKALSPELGNAGPQTPKEVEKVAEGTAITHAASTTSLTPPEATPEKAPVTTVKPAPTPKPILETLEPKVEPRAPNEPAAKPREVKNAKLEKEVAGVQKLYDQRNEFYAKEVKPIKKAIGSAMPANLPKQQEMEWLIKEVEGKLTALNGEHPNMDKAPEEARSRKQALKKDLDTLKKYEKLDNKYKKKAHEYSVSAQKAGVSETSEKTAKEATGKGTAKTAKTTTPVDKTKASETPEETAKKVAQTLETTADINAIKKLGTQREAIKEAIKKAIKDGKTATANKLKAKLAELNETTSSQTEALKNHVQNVEKTNQGSEKTPEAGLGTKFLNFFGIKKPAPTEATGKEAAKPETLAKAIQEADLANDKYGKDIEKRTDKLVTELTKEDKAAVDKDYANLEKEISQTTDTAGKSSPSTTTAQGTTPSVAPETPVAQTPQDTPANANKDTEKGTGQPSLNTTNESPSVQEEIAKDAQGSSQALNKEIVTQDLSTDTNATTETHTSQATTPVSSEDKVTEKFDLNTAEKNTLAPQESALPTQNAIQSLAKEPSSMVHTSTDTQAISEAPTPSVAAPPAEAVAQPQATSTTTEAKRPSLTREGSGADFLSDLDKSIPIEGHFSSQEWEAIRREAQKPEYEMRPSHEPIQERAKQDAQAMAPQRKLLEKLKKINTDPTLSHEVRARRLNEIEGQITKLKQAKSSQAQPTPGPAAQEPGKVSKEITSASTTVAKPTEVSQVATARPEPKRPEPTQTYERQQNGMQPGARELLDLKGAPPPSSQPPEAITNAKHNSRQPNPLDFGTKSEYMQPQTSQYSTNHSRTSLANEVRQQTHMGGSHTGYPGPRQPIVMVQPMYGQPVFKPMVVQPMPVQPLSQHMQQHQQTVHNTPAHQMGQAPVSAGAPQGKPQHTLVLNGPWRPGDQVQVIKKLRPDGTLEHTVVVNGKIYKVLNTQTFAAPSTASPTTEATASPVNPYAAQQQMSKLTQRTNQALNNKASLKERVNEQVKKIKTNLGTKATAIKDKVLNVKENIKTAVRGKIGKPTPEGKQAKTEAKKAPTEGGTKEGPLETNKKSTELKKEEPKKTETKKESIKRGEPIDLPTIEEPKPKVEHKVETKVGNKRELKPTAHTGALKEKLSIRERIKNTFRSLKPRKPAPAEKAYRPAY